MSQTSLFDADLSPVFDFPSPVVARPGNTVTGWVKTYQKTGANPLPTLNFVNGDGNEYHEATFGLAHGVGTGIYSVSRCRGVRQGSGPYKDADLMSLYEAVQRGLAWRIDK